MHFYGLIHAVDLNTKVISIKSGRKLFFFYFQNSLMHLFKRYLYSGVIIEFDYNEDDLVLKNYCLAYQITQVHEIYSPSRFGKKIFYDKSSINEGLKRVLNNLDNMLFLDLEMTMPEYRQTGHFVSQIIQAGMYLTDSNFKELYRDTIYIKPQKTNKLSKRTIDFLKIAQSDFDKKAICYDQFYETFKGILKQYNPTILIYGKNDIIALDNSYKINTVESLKPICRFINLNTIIKQFYSLKSDPGLFKLYEYYYHVDSNQRHNALDDAYVTFLVFKAFLENVNNRMNLQKEFK